MNATENEDGQRVGSGYDNGGSSGATESMPSRETLEQERANLTSALKDVRQKLDARNRSIAMLLEEETGLREGLVALRSTEHAAMDELAFLASEKLHQEKVHKAASDLLDGNVGDIEKAARRMEFARGELEALKQQLQAYIGEVPEMVDGMNQLEDRINQASSQFEDMVERLAKTAKDFKLSYYQKRSEQRGKNASY
jgi:chromosome segregation ATPase